MTETFLHTFELPNGHEARLSVLPGTLSWGEGSIVVPELSTEQISELTRAVTDALVEVDAENMAKSGCTDGRGRLSWLDGSEAPVLQKLVGTDLLTAFAMTEALGDKFYGSLHKASSLERLSYVMDFMEKNGITPTTHEGCGARNSFPALIANGLRFTESGQPELSRLAHFSRGHANDGIIEYVRNTWATQDYSDYDTEIVRKKVLEVTGPQGVKVLHEDHDHHAHGHNELAIARLWTPGIALSARKFAQILSQSSDELLTSGQAFSNNDDRLFALADKIADGQEQLDIAITAGNLYTDAAHATLGKGQVTIEVEDLELAA